MSSSIAASVPSFDHRTVSCTAGKSALTIRLSFGGCQNPIATDFVQTAGAVRGLPGQIPVQQPPPDEPDHDRLHLPDRVGVPDRVPAGELVDVPLEGALTLMWW